MATADPALEPVKVVIIGTDEVGKTTLMNTLCGTKGDNAQASYQTSEYNVTLTDCSKVDDEEATLDSADVFLLCYAVDSGTSAGFLSVSHEEILRHKRGRTEAILVGLKSDLRLVAGLCTIVKHELEIFAKNLVAVDFIECSCETNENIEHLRETILDAYELNKGNRLTSRNTALLRQHQILDKMFNLLQDGDFDALPELVQEVMLDHDVSNPIDIVTVLLNAREDYEEYVGKGACKKISAAGYARHVLTPGTEVPVPSPMFGYDEAALLCVAAGAGDEGVVRFLVMERGLDVNGVAEVMGATPLISAVYTGNEGMVATLVAELGADPSLGDEAGGTPADLARELGFDTLAALLADSKGIAAQQNHPSLRNSRRPVSLVAGASKRGVRFVSRCGLRDPRDSIRAGTSHSPGKALEDILTGKGDTFTVAKELKKKKTVGFAATDSEDDDGAESSSSTDSGNEMPAELAMRPANPIYPLARLQQRPLPDDVTAFHLEDYLDPAEFEATFAMTVDDFKQLPLWKQRNMKTAVKLF